jgi:hypothetical protein
LPENLVFDNTGHNDAANFQRSLKGMANHLHTTYSAEVAEAILKMQAVSINVEDQPPIKTDPTTKLPVPLEQPGKSTSGARDTPSNQKNKTIQ